ncbi:hypothetical protein BHM03_00056385, partial [Ensete ventricosum]
MPVIGSEASHLGISGPWITKSYLEMILESKGVRRLNTPPPASTKLVARSQDTAIAVPRPIRVSADILPKLEDLTQPWTRSPTKSDMESVLPRWRLISGLSHTPSSFVIIITLVLMYEALLENNGFPVIVGIGMQFRSIPGGTYQSARLSTIGGRLRENKKEEEEENKKEEEEKKKEVSPFPTHPRPHAVAARGSLTRR